MKRVLAVAVMSVLAFLGFAGTASAADDIDEALLAKCEAEFEDALSDFVAGLDDVQFDQFVYDWEDLWTKWEDGTISDEELIAGLDAITGGLFTKFLECLDTEEPKKPDLDEPRKPATVPTSVPAGALPDTGSGVTAALIGLGLAAAGSGILLARRLVNHS